MLVFEFKIKAKPHQLLAIDEAIRTTQFIRNKCLRYWCDASAEDKVNGYDLNKYTKVLADNKTEYPFVAKLNSMARQAAAERAWFAISNFYSRCKKGAGKKGYPKFKKGRSVEYKTCGWQLNSSKTRLTITDKTGIGQLKLIGTRDLGYYDIKQIKRIRLIKRADGYYAQICIDQERKEDCTTTNNAIGLDVGLESFYTDSNGQKVENPRFLRKAESKLKRLQRKLSKKKKGSKNRQKAKDKLARQHLKVARQRKDHAVKLARCVMESNDFVAIENLNVKGLAKSRLAKSVNDAGWTIFRNWLEYFAKLFGRELVAVSPHYTSQDCSSCGNRVKKSLSTRTHICECGCVLDRDHNAGLNILAKALDAVGRTESLNDSGQINLCQVSVDPKGQPEG